MGSNTRLKYSGVAAALLLFGSACSGSDSSGTSDASDASAGGDLAFAETSGSELPLGCTDMVATLIRSGGLLENENQAALMEVWVAAAPLTKPPGTKYLEILNEGQVAESEEESGEAASAADLVREIDDLTYQACGTPAYSAAAALSVAEAHPLYLPCFTYQPSRESLDGLLYGAVDCGTGQSLFLGSDGEWHSGDEPAPTTSTLPAPTTSRVTRPDPSTTKPTTTQPTTSSVSTSVDSGDPTTTAGGGTTTTSDGSSASTSADETLLTTTTTVPDPP